jgi:hypothetical protein
MVQPKFNAESMCTRRRVEYLVPLRILVRLHTDHGPLLNKQTNQQARLSDSVPLTIAPFRPICRWARWALRPQRTRNTMRRWRVCARCDPPTHAAAAAAAKARVCNPGTSERHRPKPQRREARLDEPTARWGSSCMCRGRSAIRSFRSSGASNPRAQRRTSTTTARRLRRTRRIRRGAPQLSSAHTKTHPSQHARPCVLRQGSLGCWSDARPAPFVVPVPSAQSAQAAVPSQSRTVAAVSTPPVAVEQAAPGPVPCD